MLTPFDKQRDFRQVRIFGHEAVVQKRRGKLSRGVLFLQDNASVHTARVSRQALKDMGFSKLTTHPTTQI
ncbi:hypothetical protein EVAR_93927_1 [Eumeta japonica]|uniref:Mariner Mos1 transposase n=1 Tax=Eumeta variegata TaxID=151549 RepID=A0A4C1TP42_EUMVA|nr:hypothetical protein EVAR_93927_1 [Eumeta japonica]